MVNGTAFRPFIYRVLIPTLANKISLNIPPEIRSNIQKNTTKNIAIKSIFLALNWNIKYAIYYYTVILLMYISLWGFVFSFTYLLKGVYQTSSKAINVITLLTLFGLPCLYTYMTYIYDFTTLFLFTLGLATMIRRKWFSYLFIFVLACLNKETTIFLLLIFAIHFINMKKVTLRTYLSLLFIQLIIFICIKVFIDILFINNPGHILYFLLARNMLLLLHPYQITSYLQWLLLGYLVFQRWSEKPLFLKHSLTILIPLLTLSFFFGFIDELRDYYEVYPIIVLLVSFPIAKSLKVYIKSLA